MRATASWIALMLALAPMAWAEEAAAPVEAAAPATASADPTIVAEDAARAKVSALIGQLKPQTGEIALPGGKAKLTLPASLYYLSPEDSRSVLVDLWGNPPEAAANVLGMIFPAGKTPADDVWGAVLTYEDSGYVSDKDATTIDYSKLLSDMQANTRGANEERTQNGYPSMELVGWAEPPRYDSAAHKLYWAKDLHVAGETQDTLNYDMRVLGRTGVLSVQFIAALAQLNDVKAAAPSVLAAASFVPGQRYEDFVQGDKAAGYGLAALIAGGGAVAAAKKVGLLGILLAFAKKGWVLLVAAFGGLSRLFGRKKTEATPAA